MKCYQSTCDKEATHIVYWPGKTPPPRYCWEDAIRANNILAIMGVPVNIELIEEYNGRNSKQEV